VAAELGCDDFGGDDYRTGLRVLLQSMDYDARFTPRGGRFAWGQVIGTLRARAHAVRAMRQHPDYAANAITGPVVITGIPRSGTTALHRLLAVDDRFQGLQSWLLEAPMPRPPRDRWTRHPEYRRVAAELEARSGEGGAVAVCAAAPAPSRLRRTADRSARADHDPARGGQVGERVA
jgi:hypothetical protein